MRYTYPVLVIEDELGGYCTYLNDFDQVTQGDNIAEAIEMGADLLEIMLDDYLQLDKPLPKPTYPTEHEGLLVAISVDVNTERGLLTADGRDRARRERRARAADGVLGPAGLQEDRPRQLRLPVEHPRAPGQPTEARPP